MVSLMQIAEFPVLTAEEALGLYRKTLTKGKVDENKINQEISKRYPTKLQKALKEAFGEEVNVNPLSVVWHNPKDTLLPIIIRASRRDGRQVLIALLYSDVSSNSQYIGTFVFETGSPGLSKIFLKETFNGSFRVCVAQARLTDNNSPRSEKWYKKTVSESSDWEVQGYPDSCKAWLWFDQYTNKNT